VIAVRRIKGAYSQYIKGCVMALAFPGNYRKLQKAVRQTGLSGKWRELNTVGSSIALTTAAA
jgi:hypothetical protein